MKPHSRETVFYFFHAYPLETMLAIGLLFLAGVVEIVGISAFLPFLQIVLEGQTSLETLPEGPIRSVMQLAGFHLDFKSVSFFIVGAITLKAFFLWLAMRKVSHCVAFISHDFRSRLMQALLNARWRYFVSNALGANLNSLVMETHRASISFVNLTGFTASVIQVFVYVVAALLVSWEVAFFGLAVGCVVGAALWFLIRIARRAGMSTTQISKRLLQRMGDIIQGIKPMRAMGLEKEFSALLDDYSTKLQKAQASMLVSGKTLQISHEPLMVIAVIIGLFTIMKVGELPTGELALMAVLLIRMLMGINKAQSQYQSYVIQESALWSLLHTIDEIEKQSDDWSGRNSVSEKIKSIVFKDVSFAYDEVTVLSGADMTFEAGSLTALVGASGSGKTTVLDIISGFYTADTGAVLVDGKDLQSMDIKQWRERIGFVPQDVFLFNDTIAENIRLGRKNISEEMIRLAAHKAGADMFVNALPEGIHSSVGESGRKLSGGQRQRIAIARSIVHNPHILLLDEATSGLDPETEKQILRTLQGLKEDMIVVFSSHSLAALDYADHIYHLQAGRVHKKNKKAIEEFFEV